MIPSAHIDRSYHGLLQGKKRPCVECGHNLTIATKQRMIKFRFKIHRMERIIDNGPLPKIPVMGGNLAFIAKMAGAARLLAHDIAVRRKKALVITPEPEGEVIYLNPTIGVRNDR